MDDTQYSKDVRLLRTIGTRVVIATVALAISFWFYKHRNSFKPASDQNIWLSLALLGAMIFPVFMAIGAMLERVRWGLIAGAILTGTFLIYLLVVLSLVGI